MKTAILAALIGLSMAGAGSSASAQPPQGGQPEQVIQGGGLRRDESIRRDYRDHQNVQGMRDDRDRGSDQGVRDWRQHRDMGRHAGWREDRRHYGWRHHRRCTWTWRHHHRVRRCW